MSSPARYRERLSVPRWWHACTPVFGVMIGGEMVLTDHPVIAGAVVGAVTLLAELFIWGLGRARIVVADGKIRVGTWRLPVGQVRRVAQLDRAEMREEQRRRDLTVYRCTAAWIPGGVLLDVDDPDDLPLWLVSTRNPEGLTQALADEILAHDAATVARA